MHFRLAVFPSGGILQQHLYLLCSQENVQSLFPGGWISCLEEIFVSSFNFPDISLNVLDNVGSRFVELHISARKVWDIALIYFTILCRHSEPTERPKLVGEVSTNLWGQKVPRGRRDGSLRAYSRFPRLEPLLFLSSSSSVVLTRLSGPRSRLLRNSGSAGNRLDLWICSQEFWLLDHTGGHLNRTVVKISRFKAISRHHSLVDGMAT
jgi:hypothetical protein